MTFPSRQNISAPRLIGNVLNCNHPVLDGGLHAVAMCHHGHSAVAGRVVCTLLADLLEVAAFGLIQKAGHHWRTGWFVIRVVKLCLGKLF